jgi:hypothetical protein
MAADISQNSGERARLQRIVPWDRQVVFAALSSRQRMWLPVSRVTV